MATTAAVLTIYFEFFSPEWKDHMTRNLLGSTGTKLTCVSKIATIVPL